MQSEGDLAATCVLFRSLASPTLRSKVSLSLLAAAIAYFVCAYAKADSITTLLVRASNGLTDKLAVALFPYAETTKTVVPANIEPAVIFREFCGGSVTDTYLDLVKRANPAIPSPLAKTPTDRTYDLPACPQLKRTGATTTVQPGETLETLIRRTMGVGPSDAIQDCTPTGCYATTPRASIARRNGGTLSDLDHLTPGRIIQLPYIAYWTTVPLKPDASAANVVADVNRPCLPSVAGALQPPSTDAGAGTPASGTSATVCPPTAGPTSPAVQRVRPPDAAPSTKVTLIHPLRADDPMVAASACTEDAAATRNKWPFDGDDLARAIKRSRDQAERAGWLEPHIVIRIVDDGFTGIATFFPEAVIAQNPLPPNEVIDENKVGRYGLFPDNALGHYESPQGYEYPWHGTEVADLALGGHYYRSLTAVQQDLVQVNFATAYKALQPTVFAVDDTVLLRSIDAVPPTAFVLNDSMGDANYASVFDKALTAGTKTLVVVAAGNRGVRIDGGNPSYPAMTGARGVPNLIVVGALDRNGNPARFSNISDEHVDLFAPGCAIPTELPDGSKPYLNGTSFAAPVVAFTGALIRALDRNLSTPALVKRRIYATADYNPLLAGKSISGSQLNIIRAVSLYDDILTTAAGDIPGEWQHQPSMEPCIDSNAFNSSNLLAIKILPTEAQGNPRARILFKVGNDAFDMRECQLKPDAAVTFKGPDGQVKDYLLGGIRALVPRAVFLHE